MVINYAIVNANGSGNNNGNDYDNVIGFPNSWIFKASLQW